MQSRTAINEAEYRSDEMSMRTSCDAPDVTPVIQAVYIFIPVLLQIQLSCPGI
jgi:hypothetical protein